MNRQTDILTFRRTLILAVGLLAAILSIWSLSLQLEVRKVSLELHEEESEKSGNNQDENHVYFQEYQASTNQIQIHIDILSELTERIPEKIRSIRKAYYIYIPIQERLFKTLFQHIISPNAP
ncbi:hypothetical protein ACFLU5_15820 [Bacteroidota bacterium]